MPTQVASSFESLSDDDLIKLARTHGIPVVADLDPMNMNDEQLIQMAKDRSIEIPPSEKEGELKTVATKGLQGILQGYLPQVSGAFDAATGSAQRFMQNRDLEKQGFTISQPGAMEDYIVGRDAKTEELNKMSAQSPVLSALSEGAGSVGSAVYGGRLLGLGAPAGLLGGVTRATAAGALYAPETKKGELPQENISGQVGARAVQGGSAGLLSGLLGVLGKTASAVKSAIKPTEAAQSLARESAEDLAMTRARPELSKDLQIIEGTQKEMLAPRSIKELESRVKSIDPKLLERPQRQAVMDAEKALPYKPSLPLTKVDEAILGSTSQERTIKSLQERPEYAALFSKQAQARKGEAALAIDAFAAKISGKPSVPGSKLQAGEEFLADLSGGYESMKKALGPQFDAIHAVPISQATMAKGAQLIAKDVLPKSTLAERRILKDAFKKLQEPNVDLRRVQEIREILRDSIDPTKPAQFRGTRELRSRLLNMMEFHVTENAAKAGMNPPLVRETFTGWAKNESLRSKIEDLIGADLRNLDAASPDKVFDSIFKNVATVRQLKNEVGEPKMRELVGSLIASIKSGATKDTGELMSAKFANSVRSKGNELSQIMKPDEIKQLKALSTYYRGIEHLSATMNPSGTGAAMETILSRNASSLRNPINAVMNATLGRLDRTIRKSQAKSEIEGLLGTSESRSRAGGLIKQGVGLLPAAARAGQQEKSK